MLSCVTLAYEEPYTAVGLFINQILVLVSHTQLVSDHGWNTNDIRWKLSLEFKRTHAAGKNPCAM